MITVEDIGQMSQSDKLRIMEALWQDLSASGGEVDSPAWHGEELQATAKRAALGLEQPVDWAEAKRMLREDRQCT